MPHSCQSSASPRVLSGRFMCWDDALIAASDHIDIRLSEAKPQNIALLCDDEWEGECNGYATVLKVPNGYRMYYRAMPFKYRADGSEPPVNTSVFCVAESHDGIHFEKPDVGLYAYNGSRHNNIIYAEDGRVPDTFSICYDENPACPDSERYKALTEGRDEKGNMCLVYLASADGYHFVRMRNLPIRGEMDSYNTVFWDRETALYHIYYRVWQDKEGNEYFNFGEFDPLHAIRCVYHATSPDFVTWIEHGRIELISGAKDEEMYTNQISRYPRANSMFIGFPTRYVDRRDDMSSFEQMPIWDFRSGVIEHHGREGSALTDCLVMTSYDGTHFDRRDEAFLTPGPEDEANWWYADCYPAYGLIETRSAKRGADPEISFYMGENNRIKKVHFRRYTVRTDGFFSWFAPYKGGEVTTVPFTMGQGELILNFATSCAGGIRVSILEENGEIIPGYESHVVFGDSINRRVIFDSPISALAGKTVRLRFAMSDAHLYSFGVL